MTARYWAAGVLALSLAAGAAQAEPDRAWVQAIPGGRELRLAVSADDCPTVKVDGVQRATSRRIGRDGAFAVTVCALPLAPSARAVEAFGATIAVAPTLPQRIVILGDTGCRVKGKKVQACDDPRQWPFAQVARFAAARHPDLVIHVGDYLYRESACPIGDTHCAGSPHGDAWPTWTVDFFEPAGPLLTAAPWVFVRGNHESCARSAVGWFRLLDAAPTPAACPADSAPFAVDLGPESLVVLDSADTDDIELKHDKEFRAEFEAAIEAAPHGKPVWVVTHRPVWGLTPNGKLGPLSSVEVGLNRSEQEALHGEDLKRVDLFLSGHIHEFEALDFGPGRPPQLVVGTGGDIPEKGAKPQIQDKHVSLDGKTAHMLEFARWGYLVLDRTRNGWSGAFYDSNDELTATCRISGRKLDCRPVKP